MHFSIGPLAGSAMGYAGTGNALSRKMRFDQTYLAQSIAEPNAVIRAFPVR